MSQTPMPETQVQPAPQTTTTVTTPTTSTPRADETTSMVNKIMQHVIALALMDESEICNEEGKKLIKELRKVVKEFLLKSVFRT